MPKLLANNIISLSNVNDGAPGVPGAPGSPGIGYTLTIEGGVRGISYAANGTTPSPSGDSTYTFTFLKNGVTASYTGVVWTLQGLTQKSATGNTLIATIPTTCPTQASITISLKETTSSPTISTTIPIICTKNADGLDWINDWNSNSVVVDSKKIVTPKIFAGTKDASNKLTGVALGREVISGGANGIIGLVGYKANIPVFSLDQNANLLISANGNASSVISGASSGLFFDGYNLHISGSVSIKGGTIGTQEIDVNTLASAADKIDNLDIVGRNLLKDSKREVIGQSEFVQYADIAPIFDTHGIDNKYTISFDIKASKSGNVAVYCQNGSTKKYEIGLIIVSCSTEYRRESMTFTPTIFDNTTNESQLAFYGTWGTGVFPCIKNVKVEKGLEATEWTAAAEDIDKSIIDIGNTANSAKNNAQEAQNTALLSSGKIDKVLLDVDGNTRIRGDLLTDGSITGKMIKAGSFTIEKGPEGAKTPTFVVNADGNIFANGTFESDSFDEERNIGYRITPEGNAIFNQAKIRGELELPNAGITNYGATIGNENLFKGYAREVVLNTYQSVSSFTQFNNCLSFNPADFLGREFTVSFFAKSPNGDTPLQLYNMNNSPKYFFFTTTFQGGVSTEWKYFKYTFTNTQHPTNTGIANRIEIYASGKTGVIVKDIKIELGGSATPWCPSPTEQLDYVRIWAGSSRLNRDIAPFRVTQNGDLFAANATISGRLVGDYDNGLVHIHNNEIVINNRTTQMNAYGEVYEISPRDHSSGAHVILNESWSLLNNNVVFGSETDKRLEFLKDQDLLSLRMGNIAIANSTRGSIAIGTNEVSSEYGVLKTSGQMGGMHRIKYYNGSSGMVFDSVGSNLATAETPYDYKFERNGGKGQVVVKVQGNLQVSESISSQKNDIEMRSCDDGWGFFAK